MLQSCYVVSTSSVKIVSLNGQYDNFLLFCFSVFLNTTGNACYVERKWCGM